MSIPILYLFVYTNLSFFWARVLFLCFFFFRILFFDAFFIVWVMQIHYFVWTNFNFFLTFLALMAHFAFFLKVKTLFALFCTLLIFFFVTLTFLIDWFGFFYLFRTFFIIFNCVLIVRILIVFILYFLSLHFVGLLLFIIIILLINSLLLLLIWLFFKYVPSPDWWSDVFIDWRVVLFLMGFLVFDLKLFGRLDIVWVKIRIFVHIFFFLFCRWFFGMVNVVFHIVCRQSESHADFLTTRRNQPCDIWLRCYLSNFILP